MSDSESYSSLMDLVNCHLSKTSLNVNQSSNEDCSNFPLASVRIQTGLSQTVFTPPNGIIPIPRLKPVDSEINGILAQQVTNMLIAKEKKKQEEEEQRLKDEAESKKLEDDYVIDLVSCIVTPDVDRIFTTNALKRTSNSGSLESLADIREFGRNKMDKGLEKPIDSLPLNQDMSYMLFRKVNKGRPSAFGKVISSRVRQVAAPYLRVEIINSAVERFDFSTQSPCDINLEKRRHPQQYPYAHVPLIVD